MNELRDYFEHNEKRLINKFDHYFDVYDRYFNQYRNKKITILIDFLSHSNLLSVHLFFCWCADHLNE